MRKWKKRVWKEKMINNEFYNDLDWYKSAKHPVALLKRENECRIPWLNQTIEQNFGKKKCQILDIGCGGGFTTNALAKEGHEITGIDLSEESLEIARQNDTTKSVKYQKENAYDLPFRKESFDIVWALDLLEHVEEPAKVVAQASYVLKPGGLFFFHTFTRNWFSYLFVIKGVEWFIKNTPKNLHVYNLFIKPREMRSFCQENFLNVECLYGSSPKINKAFFKLLFTRIVPKDFEFKFTQEVSSGYTGFARKV